eukprot:SAG11_NODE_398_length_9776_cov_4.798801_6_plen_789_part_00
METSTIEHARAVVAAERKDLNRRLQQRLQQEEEDQALARRVQASLEGANRDQHAMIEQASIAPAIAVVDEAEGSLTEIGRHGQKRKAGASGSGGGEHGDERSSLCGRPESPNWEAELPGAVLGPGSWGSPGPGHRTLPQCGYNIGDDGQIIQGRRQRKKQKREYEVSTEAGDSAWVDAATLDPRLVHNFEASQNLLKAGDTAQHKRELQSWEQSHVTRRPDWGYNEEEQMSPSIHGQFLTLTSQVAGYGGAGAGAGAGNAHPGGLDSLLATGFEQAAATRALSAANGDVNRAATSLALESPTQVRVMSGTASPPGSSAGNASDEQTTAGEEAESRRPKPRGLHNPGNWCWLNATIQALMALHGSQEYTVRDTGDHPKGVNAAKKSVAAQLTELCRQLAETDSGEEEEPPTARALRDSLHKLWQLENPGQQHGLFNTTDQCDANEAWSHITHALLLPAWSTMEYRTTCSRCDRTRVHSEISHEIAAFPREHASLARALKSTYAKRSLDFRCEACKVKCGGEREEVVTHFGDYVNVRLQRTENLETVFDAPENLNFGAVLANDDDLVTATNSMHAYELRAVTVKDYGIGYGHYKCIVKKNRSWFTISDKNVSGPSDTSAMATMNAARRGFNSYSYFYRRVKPNSSLERNDAAYDDSVAVGAGGSPCKRAREPCKRAVRKRAVRKRARKGDEVDDGSGLEFGTLGHWDGWDARPKFQRRQEANRKLLQVLQKHDDGETETVAHAWAFQVHDVGDAALRPATALTVEDGEEKEQKEENSGTPGAFLHPPPKP